VGQAVAVLGFVKMCHGDTVNANAQAGCRLLAKTAALVRLRGRAWRRWPIHLARFGDRF
jgi:hypothetical protein